jgi:hypothetical protein
MAASGVEDDIFITLWRQNDDGTEKNFSPQDAKLHQLPTAITDGIPPLPFLLPAIN